MSDLYGTALDDIKMALKDKINDTTSFASTTSLAYIPGARNSWPNIRVRLTNDRIQDIGPVVSRHLTTFECRIQNRGTGTEDDLDDMIGYAGEVVDVIEANRRLGTSYVENAEVTNISYSMSSRDRDSVMYYAYLSIEIEHLRTG